ncbi:related to transcriptional repressor [Phialocephala subalpina]|uniref:Related to transcriptional repressor n=1 Tax=Phialocephala subalpina TaxID=576137 RepID=A0A1L7X712_9HELO|nr:related to transcriptional repressor [Phialocephala subalpina]
MSTRPSMQARDSSGKRVSLLNDEPSSSQKHQLPIRTSSHSNYDHPSMARSNSSTSARSSTSSPHTPSLIRADSFDSNIHDPLSPITPTLMPDFARHNSYSSAGYKDQAHFDYRRDRYEDYAPSHCVAPPGYAEHRQSSYGDPRLYDEESYRNPNVPERGPKRYPCRYRESHGCEKTFTTSGHASRHSKIHTAEKAVSCTWPGCQKKFTRADNMKQHLETHNKERSRSSGIPKAGLKTLTMPAGIKKPSSSPTGRTSRPSSRNTNSEHSSIEPPMPPVDPAILYQTGPFAGATQYASYSTLASPPDTYGSQQPSLTHLNRPLGPRRESQQSSGLDALAIAADFQSQS